MTRWLVSSTFYGQWLPGDPRGSITSVRDRRPGDPALSIRIEHAEPGEEFEDAMPGLLRASIDQLQGPAVAVDLPQAEQLLEQFQETASHRGWMLHAVSIMFNHVHLVVEAPPEAGKTQLLRDFKSYGARRLNRQFGPRASGTWWTDRGSCRPVRNRAGRIPPSESHPDNVFPGDASVNEPPAGEPPA